MADAALLQNPESCPSPAQEETESPASALRAVTATERALVNKCINAIEDRAAHLEAKGLTTRNFLFGVSNSLFVAWSLGGCRQNFWILYLAEVAVLLPIRWLHQIQAVPLKEHLYWLDFCWVCNFFLVASLITIWAYPDLSESSRVLIASGAWGIANGPLLLAVGFLGNALLFHDADNTASVLIHLFPSLVLYQVGWNFDEVHAAWPKVFTVPVLKNLDPWRDIYGHAAAAYFIWWLFYTVWLLGCGMKAPDAGYDTIFHHTMRGVGGDVICRLTGRPASEQKRRVMDNDFTRVDALLYMSIHAFFTVSAISVSLICYLDQWIHLLLIGSMTFLTIRNASQRYTYYMLKCYGQTLRKELGIPLNRKASALEFMP